MFQNDVTYYFEDLTPPIEDARAVITKLIEKHDEEGVAGPYFYAQEIDDLRAELPEGWSLSIDESTAVEPTKIRVTVYHAYDEADRTFDESAKDVKVIGTRIGGALVVASPEFFELEGAFGLSYTKILITPGAAFRAKSREFLERDIEAAANYLTSVARKARTGEVEARKESGSEDKHFVFIASISLDLMDEFDSKAVESQKLAFIADVIANFVNAVFLRVDSDATFYLRVRPAAGGSDSVEIGGEGKRVPRSPAIESGSVLHSIKLLNFRSDELLDRYGDIEIAFVVSSADHWDYNFLKVSEYVSYDFTVFGFHPGVNDFARQTNSNGDYDTGIESGGDGKDCVGVKMLDSAGFARADFEPRAYG